jgi:hypothetical protein
LSLTPWKSRSSRIEAHLHEWAALALVSAWPFVFYWRAALGLGMFYFGDIARFFYPTRLLYANALATGRLPLWTPELLMGFPLFAEMQTGALYPIHLLLYRILPIDLAINYDILSHLAWLAAGVFLFARARKTSIVGSSIVAFAFVSGGFGAGRITHMSVLAVAAWLPWSLLLYERWRQSTRLRYWVLLVFVFAVQMVAGHPQFIFLNVLTFIFYAVGAAFGLLDGSPPNSSLEQVETDNVGSQVGRIRPTLRGLAIRAFGFPRRITLALLPVLTVLLGAGIAAVQLLPTAELAQASARAGGVTEAFFTQFSYNPLYLALLLDPFVLGNPYPRVSVEVVAYLGAFPILLAGLAVFRMRDRSTMFWLALAAGSFLLALGGLNPLYRGLRFLPLLNFFRVPARFLFPMSFALAMLAGHGFDALMERASLKGFARSGKLAGAILAALIGTVVGLATFLDADTWVMVWRFLAPLFFAFGLFILLRAWSSRLGRGTVAVLVLGATLLDLSAFDAVYAQTFNLIAPRNEIFPIPRVLKNLELTGGNRTLTSEWKFPWVSEMVESLYPNLNAAYGVQSAQGYTPLLPHRTQDFLGHLSPAMLNLLGVRYYLIPQELPVDAQSEAADLADPFMIDPIHQPLEFPPTEATGIEVESALAQSAGLSDGYTVAIIKLTTDQGRVFQLPLRAGLETAEWAYDRSDVRRAVKHSEPPVASTFHARSAFPVESHPGHTFQVDLPIDTVPVPITRIEIAPVIPAGLLYIQKLVLTNGSGHVDVATLVGKSSHTLVYRSEDVAVFENPNPAPRAFLTHTGVVVSDEEALTRLQAPDYSGELYLADGQGLESDSGQGTDETVQVATYEPERVVLNVKANFDGYVVLTDAWDPGWVASVDGQPAPIHRADVIFRAVRVGAGTHTVEFLYRPLSLYTGMIVSGVSLALLGVILCAVWLVGGRILRPDI